SWKAWAANSIQSELTTGHLRHAPAGGGILTPFPSATALPPALGVRLTLRGLTLRRNPWTFGVRVSHPHYRYSCQHSHFRYLHKGSHPRVTGLRNAPLPRASQFPGRHTRSFGAWLEPRYIFGAGRLIDQ